MLNLLRWKLRIELARYRSSAALWIVPIFGIGLAVVTAWLSRMAFVLLVREAPAFADLVLLGAYAAVGVFQTLAGVRWGISRLFLTSDLEFLLGTPVPLRNVFAVKTFELVAASPISIAFVAALTWGYATAHGSPLAIVVALVAPLVLSVLAVLPGELATLVIARVFRSPRIQTVVAFLPFVFWAATTATASTTGDLIERVSGRPDELAELDSTGRSFVGALRFLPTSWAAGIARGTAVGEYGTVLRDAVALGVVIAGLWLLTLAVFKATFQTSWTQIATGSSRARPTSFLDNLTGPLTGPRRAIVLKEWKTFGRDTRLMTSIFFPVLVLGWLMYSSAREGSDNSPITPIVFMVAILPNIAATSLLGEKRNLNVLRAAPMRGRDVIVGKVVAYAVPIALIVAIGSAVFAIAGHRHVRDGLLLFVFASWTLGWVMLFDIALAALWGRFDMERPRIPLPLGLVPPLASVLITGAEGLLGLWVAAQLGADIGALESPALGIPIVAVAAAACAVVVRITDAGGRRLESIEPP